MSRLSRARPRPRALPSTSPCLHDCWVNSRRCSDRALPSQARSPAQSRHSQGIVGAWELNNLNSGPSVTVHVAANLQIILSPTLYVRNLRKIVRFRPPNSTQKGRAFLRGPFSYREVKV